MSKPRALIVDDEPGIRELLEVTLARMGIDVTAVGDLAGAREQLTQPCWDLCLTDMRLPDGDGIELVCEIAAQGTRTPVAVITAYGSMDTAIAALKAGAFDFISKPLDVAHLRRLVEQALRLDERTDDPADEDDDGGGLLGESAAMAELRRQIGKIARSQAPVAITGESGTGKELIARRIHALGPRAAHPFVAVNCGAIPRELMESEFFGHRRGAFTGAVTDSDGLFVAADGGTLFLDEIAELPLDMQVKLLRVIQEKRLRPVGATREIEVDVRILSASHSDLAQAVAAGTFRQDLFYRINVIALHVPPLRERREDIPVLTDAILARLAGEYGCRPPTLTHAARDALTRHEFPGNIRELENVLERALALAEGARIGADDLQLPPAPTPRAASAEAASVQPDSNSEPTAPESLEALLEEQQRQVLLEALERNRWNRTATARDLGLTYRQLRYRLKKLAID